MIPSSSTTKTEPAKLYPPTLKTVLKKCPLVIFKSNCAILCRALECGISSEINWAIKRISMISSVLLDIRKIDTSEIRRKNNTFITTHSTHLKQLSILADYQLLLREENFPFEGLISRLFYHSIPFFRLVEILSSDNNENCNNNALHSAISSLIDELSFDSNYYFGITKKIPINLFCTYTLIRYTQLLVISLNFARSGYLSFLAKFANRSVVLLSVLLSSSKLLRSWEALSLPPQPLLSVSTMLLDLLSYVNFSISPSIINLLSWIILNYQNKPWIYASRCLGAGILKTLSCEIRTNFLNSALSVLQCANDGNENHFPALYFIKNLLDSVPDYEFDLLDLIFSNILNFYLSRVVLLPPLAPNSLTILSGLTSLQATLKYLSLSYELDERKQTPPISLSSIYDQYCYWIESTGELSLLLPRSDFTAAFYQLFPNVIESRSKECHWEGCEFQSSEYGSLDAHFLSTHIHDASYCRWEGCIQNCSTNLSEHFFLAHSETMSVQTFYLKVKKDNLIPVPLSELQVALSRIVLKIFGIFQRKYQKIMPLITMAHLETISELCFTTPIIGEHDDDAYERIRIFSNLLCFVKSS